MTIECKHGQLARSCNICALEAELAEVTAQRDKLLAGAPAPSVPDVDLQAAFDRGLKAGNEQKEAQQAEIHRLHDLLAGAPTPAEAPEDVALDAERWRTLPQFLEEFQIPYLRLVEKIDAAMSEKGGA